MPPCGSPLMITTNSVPLPVSELNASSEMISEDRGEAIAEMRSSTSCGIMTRSSASFALTGSDTSGSGSGPRRARDCAAPTVDRLARSETTVHRICPSPLLRSHGGKDMRADRTIGILDRDWAF